MTLSRLDEPRPQVQDQWAHYRGTGADDCEVDFQNAREGVTDADPGVVAGEDFPGV